MRLAEFGAFVELEPGIEALAHVSTFAPAARGKTWTADVAVGSRRSFEIVTIDLARKRIGVAPIPEGSTRAIMDAGGEEAAARREQAPERLGTLADKLRGALDTKKERGTSRTRPPSASTRNVRRRCRGAAPPRGPRPAPTSPPRRRPATA